MWYNGSETRQEWKCCQFLNLEPPKSLNSVCRKGIESTGPIVIFPQISNLPVLTGVVTGQWGRLWEDQGNGGSDALSPKLGPGTSGNQRVSRDAFNCWEYRNYMGNLMILVTCTMGRRSLCSAINSLPWIRT